MLTLKNAGDKWFWFRYNIRHWFSKKEPFRTIIGLRWKLYRRFFDRYNKIEIPSLDKYSYYDKDKILTHGCFDLLVHFIEDELANIELGCNTEKYNIPWWQSLNSYEKKHARELG